MAFFNDMDRLSLKLLSPSGLELLAKNIQEAFNIGHKYCKIEDHKGIVEYLKAIRDGEDGSKELFDKYIKVVDIEEKVTEKKCNNCMNYNIWFSKEPCRSCIISGELHPNWKSKEDTSEQAKKNVNDIFGVDSIKHIEDRVESIQANVLEYGNNCVSKLIELKEKVGLSPDAEIYLKDIRQDLCDLDMRLQGLESTLADIYESLNEIKGHEKPKPKFKDGDLVKVSGYDDKIWIIRNYHYDENVNLYYYDLKSYFGNDTSIYSEGLLIPVTNSDTNDAIKPKPKFKVGDTVKYKTGSINYFVINVKKLNTGYCYDLERRFPNCSKRNYKITGILESRLEEVK